MRDRRDSNRSEERAFRAGIRTYDVITAVDGQGARGQFKAHKLGDRVTI
ncbi:hypothetical protein [Paenibacillus sedimenti]|uniref:PDZ domain-containing protein n=1 Tax=Paenibacillus sedimenti TaxID=2770274 RepID=A0A926KXI7_9BACL|nr:hypothetical protein [Paenibacillus sedimenti]MBD0384666.1 hypothetical protein [Paenibacillus sedimenti]